MTRWIAGLTGLAVLVPALLYGGVLAAEIIVCIALLICVTEFAGMAFPDDKPVATVWLTLGVAVQYLGLVHLPEFHARMLGGFTVLTMIFVTLRPGESLENAANRTARYVLGAAWIGLLPFLVLLRQLDDGIGWCFVCLGASWLGDTGAYMAGRRFGKTKLYERISPKKTVEGMLGGLLTATLGVYLLARVGVPSLNFVDCLFIGIVGCSMGVLGDLSESLLKRAFGVKDSGTIMPGHGGLLDRIDSVLFVGVVVYSYATLVK